ncbi:MAG: hydroxymethylglutaryl-CoA reductase [Dehalococcoidia bacterium]|nr:hydroxymethylglutaryl-CoA reductase [Dehalococcoidia bacterium]
MQVPSFLLRRLYVKGSLRNEDGGFAFDLKNSLGSGYAEQVLPLTVDGEEVPPEQASFSIDGQRVQFSAVSSAQPFTLAMNKVVTIGVEGLTLPAGKHKLGVGFVVTGMGTMQFDVTDAIGGAADGAGDADR